MDAEFFDWAMVAFVGLSAVVIWTCFLLWFIGIPTKPKKRRAIEIDDKGHCAWIEAPPDLLDSEWIQRVFKKSFGDRVPEIENVYSLYNGNIRIFVALREKPTVPATPPAAPRKIEVYGSPRSATFVVPFELASTRDVDSIIHQHFSGQKVILETVNVYSGLREFLITCRLAEPKRPQLRMVTELELLRARLDSLEKRSPLPPSVIGSVAAAVSAAGFMPYGTILPKKHRIHLLPDPEEGYFHATICFDDLIADDMRLIEKSIGGRCFIDSGHVGGGLDRNRLFSLRCYSPHLHSAVEPTPLDATAPYPLNEAMVKALLGPLDSSRSASADPEAVELDDADREIGLGGKR